MPDVFFPTLFQKNIEKEYEIRTFYLQGRFYSSAIFSQKDPTTSIDFRNYNKSFPNRMVPYRIPEALELQVEQLMQELDLDTGSIDFIKGVDGKFYFLEVNPVGQYGFVDVPCNYNINKIIAEELMKKDGE